MGTVPPLGPWVGQALSRQRPDGLPPTGPDRELQTVRRAMIDFLQNHTEGSRPPACPALDPIRYVALWKRGVLRAEFNFVKYRCALSGLGAGV